MAISSEAFDKINGPGASQKLEEFRAAKLEQAAQLQHAAINPKMESVAARSFGVISPDASRLIHQTGEHAVVAQPELDAHQTPETEDPVLH
jgi:hypothetical protein